MLDNYLEKNVLYQAVIMTLLLDAHHIPLQLIREETGLSLSKIKYHLTELSNLFEGKVRFKYQESAINMTILIDEPFDFLHLIYNQSIRLQCIKFLLEPKPSHRDKSVSKLARKLFISVPSAYRNIAHVAPFIEECGLKLLNNQIIGEEYRLRYLIALLHAKYGIILYEISHKDMNIIHKFIFTIKESARPHPFLDKKYIFFDLLVTLSWKRRDFNIEIPHNAFFEQLKQLTIRTYLDTFFNNEIGQEFNLSFSSNEIDYLLLVYVTVNNSFLLKYWSEEDFQKLFLIIAQDSHYQDLINRLTVFFKGHIQFNKNCLRTMIPYFRNTLFDLQILIPPKHYYLTEYQGEKQLFKSLSIVISNWVENNPGVGKLHTSNLHLLCLRLEQLIRENLSLLKIAVIEINKKQLDILYSWVNQCSYMNQVSINVYNALSDITIIKENSIDLIVTTTELTTFIKETINLGEHTNIIGLNINSMGCQSNYLSSAIRDLREKQYSDVINDILDKSQEM